jgi:hypothetical protein
LSRGIDSLVKIPVPSHWAEIADDTEDYDTDNEDEPEFVNRIQKSHGTQ